ncbi:hypothetical protein BST25_16955 [Mycobacterium heidelbergense]|uniref:Uncharacterized protein n=1 Tax=Mycobacterium heidelbergense TaxID=53376 RepID=A0A1X0DG88_MYCHE|nr:hypothetical protein BST25_16955 [Mycobacterium heidelbergense]BBZ50324.1 hypothetical protein MHEI_20410 [Mycobacterium heidelbergense]
MLFEGVRVPAANLLGGQEKLEHKLARAREAAAGSATLGTFEQTRPMVAGTPLRARAADAALSMQDRVPEPPMRLAMKALRPPGR